MYMYIRVDAPKVEVVCELNLTFLSVSMLHLLCLQDDVKMMLQRALHSRYQSY